jgi:hypothetical protein
LRRVTPNAQIRLHRRNFENYTPDPLRIPTPTR